MPIFDVSKEEWGIAKKYLLEEADKRKYFKLARADKEKNQKEITSRHGKDAYHTTHSFFKIGQFLFATNPKHIGDSAYNSTHVTAGKGTYGKVKYAISSTGKKLAIKVQPGDFYFKGNAEEVFWTSYDLHLTYSYHYRNHSRRDNKAYTVMRYLGSSLEAKLRKEKATITEAQRLKWAAKICFQVYKFHQGWASSTGTSYAHFDIKPSNFTIDELGRIRLVDYDLTVPLDTPKYCVGAIGTLWYTPHQGRKLSNKKIDEVALMRTLYLPEYFSFYNPKRDDDCDAAQCIKPIMRVRNPDNLLSKKMVEKFKLGDYIDTSYEVEDYRKLISPLKLSALLALTSIGCQHLIDKLTQKQLLAVVTLAHADCLDTDKIKHQLSRRHLVNSLATISPISDWLKPEIIKLALNDYKVMADCLSLALIPSGKRYLYVEKYNNDGKSPAFLSDTELKDKITHAGTLSDPAAYINERCLLSYCVVNNEPGLLKKCLELGADPNRADCFGYTPLMDAMWLNHRDCYTALLAHSDIDLTRKHPDGHSIEDFCYQSPLFDNRANRAYKSKVKEHKAASAHQGP